MFAPFTSLYPHLQQSLSYIVQGGMQWVGVPTMVAAGKCKILRIS